MQARHCEVKDSFAVPIRSACKSPIIVNVVVFGGHLGKFTKAVKTAKAPGSSRVSPLVLFPTASGTLNPLKTVFAFGEILAVPTLPSSPRMQMSTP
jgi:hypothetical protein